MPMIIRHGIWLLALSVGGCISETSTFHSPDGKYTNVCSGAGFGLIPTIMAINEYHKCREEYLKSGYVEVAAPK